jgi:hypothetical protein
MNALKAASIGAEIAVLSATATVAWGLVAGAGNPLVWAPMVGAMTAVELCRLPLVMRAPKLSLSGAWCALALAGAVSILTAETLVLGTESLLTARAAGVTASETALSQAATALDAAKTEAGRRDQERARLAAAVAEAQRHSAEIGREAEPLQNNPAVSAYRGRRGGWAAPGASAANAVAAANAKAQADHAARESSAEAALAAARAALTAAKPIDLTAAEADVVAAKQIVERERASSPMHRLAAALARTDTANLKAEDYEWLRRTVAVSVGAILAFGTLAAGLISALPERGDRPSRLARALRAMAAARRKTLRRLKETVRTEVRDRTVYRYVPCDPHTGKVLDPDTTSHGRT